MRKLLMKIHFKMENFHSSQFWIGKNEKLTSCMSWKKGKVRWMGRMKKWKIKIYDNRDSHDKFSNFSLVQFISHMNEWNLLTIKLENFMEEFFFSEKKQWKADKSEIWMKRWKKNSMRQRKTDWNWKINFFNKKKRRILQKYENDAERMFFFLYCKFQIFCNERNNTISRLSLIQSMIEFLLLLLTISGRWNNF